MSEIASPRQLRIAWLRWALITIPGVLLLGLISGKVGDSGYGNLWFAQLDKPAIMPPGWVFGFTWSILYIMMGTALAFILNARGAKGRSVAIALFFIQLALNLAWSPVFFAMHKIMLAFGLIIAIILWATATACAFWRVRRVAALLLLPYLVWLLFAAFLNWKIHELNPYGPALVPSTGDTQIIIQ
ncbi:MAG: tryptophan-rich sensory protein [Hyphomicrobiales bacterium]|nr:MAG: tryptophan-rich sensory protein [Hyphomicrobiales bacterium]